MQLQGRASWLAVLLASGLPVPAQDVAHTATPTVIRTETRLVLVDAVVTDKKGSYVPNLEKKDFKIYEDNKEQPITSFNYDADPAGPNNNQKHYLVLFFDNASVSAGNQMQARTAAQKFVDNNTGPNKFIAVVNFSGTMRIAQNFTNDPDRLREVISGVQTSTVSTSDSGTIGMGRMGGGGPVSLSAASSFGISSVLLGLRSLAKGLSDVPGRKMVVMLTQGFPSNDPQIQSELTATIDACNKSNVSIYPVDVRGLVAPAPSMGPGNGRGGIGRQLGQLFSPAGLGSGSNWGSFQNSFQTRGAAPPAGGAAPVSSSSGASRGSTSGTTTGTSGTTGNTGRGSTGTTTNSGNTTTTGSRGGGTSTPVANPTLNRNPMNPMNPLSNPRSIVPIITGVDSNQNALYQLAEGTGGFVIVNTNDLLGGMEKIAREQDQYYIIGFSPSESPEGSCHTLKVKLDKGGTNVRSRSGYCNVRQTDPLAGKPAETELEAIAVSAGKGNLGSPLQLPFFYASPNVARVNLAMEIPSSGFKFEKVKGKLHAEMNLLGIAYKADNSVAAKFSDTLKYDFENKTEVDVFNKKPVHYENQFDIASGEYTVKVAFSAGGDNFGKVEKPLVVEPFDGKQFSVSGLALSKQLLSAKEDMGIDAVLIEDKVPLVALGVQAVPAADYHFTTVDKAGLYLEIYDSSLSDEKPPTVGFSLNIIDPKTGQAKVGSGNQPLTSYVRPGNPVVPVILTLPLKDLPPGPYRVEFTALDTNGKTMKRTVDIDVEAGKDTAIGWGK